MSVLSFYQSMFEKAIKKTYKTHAYRLGNAKICNASSDSLSLIDDNPNFTGFLSALLTHTHPIDALFNHTAVAMR